jgi:hypothetical protein
MLFLRNLNHSRRIVVRAVGAAAGRLILPGATTAMAIDLAILADPHNSGPAGRGPPRRARSRRLMS